MLLTRKRNNKLFANPRDLPCMVHSTKGPFVWVFHSGLMSLSYASKTAWQHGKGVVFNMSKRITTCPAYSQKVSWDKKTKLFYLTVEGEKAFIEYKKHNNIIDLVHTEVPEALRGHGIAGVLAKGTFALIKEQNLHMKLSCEYLQSYYQKNKTAELTDLLVEEQRRSL